MSEERKMPPKKRCHWVNNEPLYIRYHDREWGVPVHRDRKLFEFLTLEGAQAGLSWFTILQRREGYRRVFKNFDPRLVARFTPAQIARALGDPGIIRNRLKVDSTVSNAKAFLQIQKKYGSFNRYIWQFAGSKNPKASSQKMSRELGKKGFRFVGPTICYAFMQACGLVQDHDKTCFRAREL
jgi:DNA-3-methyladenine glycosylase I